MGRAAVTKNQAESVMKSLLKSNTDQCVRQLDNPIPFALQLLQFYLLLSRRLGVGDPQPAQRIYAMCRGVMEAFPHSVAPYTLLSLCLSQFDYPLSATAVKDAVA